MTAKPAYVLGISGLYRPEMFGIGHDPSAALLRDGEIVAMAGEERLARIKYAEGLFPRRAIAFCLRQASIAIEDLAAVAWSWDPFRRLARWGDEGRGRLARRVAIRAVRAIQRWEVIGQQYARHLPEALTPELSVEKMRMQLAEHFGEAAADIPFLCVDHHLAHVASAYSCSGFDEATLISWDGGGDRLSGMVCRGANDRIEVLREYPIERFSIGIFYWLVHHYLKLADEGSLMGLSCYGTPRGHFDPYVDAERLRMDLGRLTGRFRNYSAEVVRRFGPPRLADGPITPLHRDLAADVQAVVERFGFRILREALELTGVPDVAFAGGVALNAVLNGKLGRSGLVRELFFQPNPGDGGGALGAAFVAHGRLGGRVPRRRLEHAYWGPAFDDDAIEEVLRTVGVPYQRLTREELVTAVADLLLAGKVVGWFQGRMEWGPRALGARSILADPRDRRMADRVNAVIKYRDDWRPFAPTMLEEAAKDYLEQPFYSPFMITTFPVRPARRAEIAAVVHADQTTRPQMLRRDVNPLYSDVIRRFGERSGVPLVLNTSFNVKGEPIVCTPTDALRTFYGSGLDALALGSYLLEKAPAGRR
jgi:carbamoyltransferase